MTREPKRSSFSKSMFMTMHGARARKHHTRTQALHYKMVAFQRGDSDPMKVQATAEARLETFHLKQMQACARTDAQSSLKNAWKKMCFSKLAGARACNICSTGGGARGRNYAHALHANVMRVRCCPKPFATSRRQM